MKCPDTPHTVIGELLKCQEGALWERSWQVFYDTYYDLVRVMSVGALRRVGWVDFPEAELEEIITRSFLSLLDAFGSGQYVSGKYRFRGFLKRIISRRVVDFIRRQNRNRSISVGAIELIEALQREEENDEVFDKLESDEVKVNRLATVMSVYENIRLHYDPETCQAFELTQFEGKSVKEACELLGVPRTKVDKSVHKITQRLRKELDKDIYRKELAK